MRRLIFDTLHDNENVIQPWASDDIKINVSIEGVVPRAPAESISHVMPDIIPFGISPTYSFPPSTRPPSVGTLSLAGDLLEGQAQFFQQRIADELEADAMNDQLEGPTDALPQEGLGEAASTDVETRDRVEVASLTPTRECSADPRTRPMRDTQTGCEFQFAKDVGLRALEEHKDKLDEWQRKFSTSLPVNMEHIMFDFARALATFAVAAPFCGQPIPDVCIEGFIEYVITLARVMNDEQAVPLPFPELHGANLAPPYTTLIPLHSTWMKITDIALTARRKILDSFSEREADTAPWLILRNL